MASMVRAGVAEHSMGPNLIPPWVVAPGPGYWHWPRREK